MRVIGGRLKGRKLADIGKGDAAAHLRPTTDRVRENIFNLLSNGRLGDVVTGSRVLDLFAGTGAMGIEALSRGASFVKFIDNGRVSAGLIQQNVKSLHLADCSDLWIGDVLRLGDAVDVTYDLVFLDPPYGQHLGENVLPKLHRIGWLKQAALIVWEENKRKSVPPGFTLVDYRRYGASFVHILALDGFRM